RLQGGVGREEERVPARRGSGRLLAGGGGGAVLPRAGLSAAVPAAGPERGREGEDRAEPAGPDADAVLQLRREEGGVQRGGAEPGEGGRSADGGGDRVVVAGAGGAGEAQGTDRQAGRGRGRGVTMDSEFRLLPQQASTMAPRVDALFWFITAVCVFFTLLIAVCLLFFAIRYRRRTEDYFPTPVIGSKLLETTWSVVPLMIALFIF